MRAARRRPGGLAFVYTGPAASAAAATAAETVAQGLSRDFSAWTQAIRNRILDDDRAMFPDEPIGREIEIDADGRPIGPARDPRGAAKPLIPEEWMQLLRDNRGLLLGSAAVLLAIVLVRKARAR